MNERGHSNDPAIGRIHNISERWNRIRRVVYNLSSPPAGSVSSMRLLGRVRVGREERQSPTVSGALALIIVN